MPKLFGLLAAAATLPEVPIDLEKYGFGELLAFLVWWLTTQFSKKIDDNTAEIKQLRTAIEHLVAAIDKNKKD